MLGKLKLTITRKVVGLALVVALVSMALAGSVMYLVVRHSLETQTIQNLHTIADIEEQRYGALLETGGAGAVREAAPPAFGATGETFVVRKDGSAAVSVTPLRFDSGTQGTELGTQALNAGEAVFPSVTDYRGNTVLAVTRQFAPGWGLVAKIDRAEAFAPVGVIRNIFLVLGATASILVLLLASFFGRVITHPVRGLTRAVRSFSRGNLRSRARVHSSDEIGELSETFNVMAEQLERAQHGLEAQVQEKTARLF
ncbi:MAG: HAMP domain-containing protein, partial [Patescibacteria group bacterium]